MNPEESFREGLFYLQITQNWLLYLRMFHERDPLCGNHVMYLYMSRRGLSLSLALCCSDLLMWCSYLHSSGKWSCFETLRVEFRGIINLEWVCLWDSMHLWLNDNLLLFCISCKTRIRILCVFRLWCDLRLTQKSVRSLRSVDTL